MSTETPVAPIAETPPAAPPAPAAPLAAAPPPDWTSGLDAELKGFVQTKGFQGPKDVIESYRNMERLRGVPEDRLLKLPENMDTPEGRAIWEKLGTPKDAKGYQLDIPKDIGDEKMAEWAAGEFHKLGVPKKMAEGFVKAWNERMVGAHTANQEQAALTVKQAGESLKREWGAAFDQNKNIADAAARALGLDTKEIDALGQVLGPEKAVKALHKLGLATGEHEFITGQPAGNGLMTPDQARGRIKELMTDQDFMDRWSKGEIAAKQQWQTAHEMAYPGEISI